MSLCLNADNIICFIASGFEWRHIVYDCELFDEKSPTTSVAHFIDISDNSQQFNTISPGVTYTASVRSCWNSICSTPITTTNSAFAQYHQGSWLSLSCVYNHPTLYIVCNNINDIIEHSVLDARTYVEINDQVTVLDVLGNVCGAVVVNGELR